MALCDEVSELVIENTVFGATTMPPGSTNALFLGGAGVWGLQIPNRFIKLTSIAIYLEQCAVPSLAVKYRGKSPDQLMDSLDFFMDIVSGEFEKLTIVTAIIALDGVQYAERVVERCTTYLNSVGEHGEAEAKALEQLLQVFKDQSFSPGASVVFTHSPNGILTVGFSEDESVPEEGVAVVENGAVAKAVLASIIGENDMSREVKKSLAVRLSELMKKESKSNREVVT
ncbi:hypothetical protein Sjap_001687 [Stephania japonica]|uniref:Chalcone-flavonone isomerase family protein n=1 Tax=Stephania japonica TaxID=461633 RepID=A0AAP0PRX7_9MAGN